jgi:hypothetical protein
MRKEAEPLRSSKAELEQIICSPTAKGSGHTIRLLRSKMEESVWRVAGDAGSAPSGLEKVAGLLSLDPLAVAGGVISSGREVYKSIVESLRQPELRLLSQWTSQCAFDTVGKLRQLFKTKGSGAEWRRAVNILQLRGTIAWYPFRRPLQ